jgi:hypothetical protein
VHIAGDGTSPSSWFFSQNDVKWAGDKLGTVQTPLQTIGEYGCAVTCAAMVLKSYGMDVDPARLNQWLSSNNNQGYSYDKNNYAYIKWQNAAQYNDTSNIGVSVQNTSDLSVLNSQIDKGYPVIVGVNNNSHFVVVTSRNGNTYYISDPLDPTFNPSETLNVKYGNKFTEIVVYYPLSSAVISASTPNQVMSPGSTFNVNLLINNTVPVCGWGGYLYYDSTKLTYNGSTEGTFLKNNGSTSWITPQTSTPGVIGFGCTLGQNASAPPGKNGLIATISFTVKADASGFTLIDASNIGIVDSDLNPIQDVTYNNGIVSVPSVSAAKIQSGGASVANDDNSVAVNITGSDVPDGTNVSVTSANFGNNQPLDTTTLLLANPAYYDVNVSSTSNLGTNALAQIYISSPFITSQTLMQYWDGKIWNNLSNISMSGTTISGFISVSSLGGTPIAIGNQSVTLIAITSSTNPSYSGRSVSLDASFSPIPDGGSVQFQDGGADLGNPVSIDSTGNALYTTSSLAVGNHTITAVYSGDENFATSTGMLSQVVISSSSDATLSSLAISSGTLTPTFAPGTTSYTDSVASGVGSFTITPVANQADVTITVNGNSVTSGQVSGIISLNVGSNNITILVTAQDGITKDIYIIAVNRAAILGDANGDGVVNILDMTKVAREILGLDTVTPGADANSDGVVNILDMTKIARIILGLDP